MSKVQRSNRPVTFDFLTFDFLTFDLRPSEVRELPPATNVSRGQHEGMCWVLTAAAGRRPADKNVGFGPVIG